MAILLHYKHIVHTFVLIFAILLYIKLAEIFTLKYTSTTVKSVWGGGFGSGPRLKNAELL